MATGLVARCRASPTIRSSGHAAFSACDDLVAHQALVVGDDGGGGGTGMHAGARPIQAAGGAGGDLVAA